MGLLRDTFVPARGMANAHLQTVVGVLARRVVPGELRRVRLETPDRDFVDVDVLSGAPARPTVLLLHGLEGSSASGYVRVMLRGLAARRWSGVAVNFRSCSGEPNRLAASYSSGDTRDVRWLASGIAKGELDLGVPRGPLFAVGFSLGGSVLLNLVAREATALAAAAAVSTPYDLDACARSIDSGRGAARLYLQNFLPTMKRKALEKAARFPGLLDARKVASARTIREFDEVVTAPLFGFRSAEDYYAQCSTAALLHRVSTPALLVSAEDDPLAPARHLPGDAHRSASLDVLITRAGGHVGFVGGSLVRPSYWVEDAVLRWLDARMDGLPSAG